MKKTYIIKDSQGLHARPASLLAKVAASFTEESHIEYKGKMVPLKSILGVMSLSIQTNAEITIHGTKEILLALDSVLIEQNLI